MNDLTILGTRIAELRKRCHLTQETLANELGVTVSAVSKWETGASMPDLSVFRALADFFRISTDYLLGRDLTAQFLLCDDSYFTGNMTTDILRQFGYTASAFENSEQLFHALTHTRPYGILLDVHFPNENGLDILKRLKAEHPDIPVIMLTADMTEEVHALALEYGASAFVYKPFSVEKLLTAVESILM